MTALKTTYAKIAALLCAAVLALVLAPVATHSQDTQAYAMGDYITLSIVEPTVGATPSTACEPYMATWPISASVKWTQNGAAVSKFQMDVDYTVTATVKLSEGEFPQYVLDEFHAVFENKATYKDINVTNITKKYGSSKDTMLISGTYRISSKGPVVNNDSSFITDFEVTSSASTINIYAAHSGYATFIFENVDNGTYLMVNNKESRPNSNITPQLGTQYIGYALSTSKMNWSLFPSSDSTNYSEYTWYTLSSSAKTFLQSNAAYQSVRTPNPDVSDVTLYSNGKNFKKSIVHWTVSDEYHYSGVKVYKAGKLVQTITGKSNLQTSLTIPYAGTTNIYVVPFYEYNGKTFLGTKSNVIGATSEKIKSPKPVVVKISSSKVRLSWTKTTHSTGYYVYKNTGSGWKKIKTTTSNSCIYSATGAGKSTVKYRIKAYIKTDGKTYSAPSASAYAKPLANKYIGGKMNLNSLNDFEVYARVTDVHYTNTSSSKGTLKVSLQGANTWFYTTYGVKATVTVYNQGKTIAKQTFKVGGIKPHTTKTLTFSFNTAKTGYDLRTATVSLSNVKKY